MANSIRDYEPLWRTSGDSQNLDTLEEIKITLSPAQMSHLRAYCHDHRIPMATFVRRLITREIGDPDAQSELRDRAQAAATSVLSAIAAIEGHSRAKRTRSQQ